MLSMWRLAALIGLSAACLFLYCAPVLAHATLLEAEPEAGATLAQAPDQVRLRFDEPIEAEFDPLKVYDQQGDRVDRDDARVDPDDARVLVSNLEELPAGSYMVEWRVTSLDGHIVGDTYQFTVATSAGQSPGTTRTDNGDAGEPNPALQSHTIHLAALGLAALVLLVLALLRQR